MNDEFHRIMQCDERPKILRCDECRKARKSRVKVGEEIMYLCDHEGACIRAYRIGCNDTMEAMQDDGR